MAHYDVAIIGGGPAGSATAITLARLGRRVLLADSAPAGRFRVGEGFPPAARSLLADLGVLDDFLAAGHRPSYGNLSLWGSDEPHMDDFIFQTQGRGYQLDRCAFDAQLRKAARQFGVTVHEATRLAATPDTDGFNLCLSDCADEQTAHSSWLIDAGGRPAVLARKLGAQRMVEDRLTAFYLLLHSTQASDQDGRTLVEAVEDGWWYSVLLPSGERLVAFLGDLDLLDRQQLLDSDGLWQQLAHTRLLSALCREHGYQSGSAVQGMDAASGRLSRFHGEGWATVGDAALSFDPLSSQGIATALYCGQYCARAVHATLQGDDTALAAYADLLNRIYSAYLNNRRQFYGMEKRWGESTFWKRRQPLPVSA
ncbi:Dehydrogenase (flavoprotein) [Pseudomonas asplenii]|uniref:Dehydrogenase (Flavoprotein) n=1 Tax=Pseudomonas asplenii TaxID=53407 RepID=A0A1H1R6W2_9PSED|nr:tryptophan 7-halogenase [Pseudomonas asplenii]SDS31481.1 Dehydrogenase (flavoprotein) [Pseudomonas asplenii]